MHDVRSEKRGFTLIELLVVMAIIAIFLGVLGMALSRTNSTVAAQSGQRMLAGLATGARGQAILKQADVRLIVHCDPPNAGDSPEVQQEKRDRYLRYVGAVVRTLDTSVSPPVEEWKPVNDGVYLPRGIYVVPPLGLDTAFLPAPVISGDDKDWAHARRSVVAASYTEVRTNTYEFHSKHPPQAYFHIEFSGRGMVSSGQFPGANEGRLVVAPARETATTPRFEDESDTAVLGGVFRSYGSMTLVHDAAAFPDFIPAP